MEGYHTITVAAVPSDQPQISPSDIPTFSKQIAVYGKEIGNLWTAILGIIAVVAVVIGAGAAPSIISFLRKIR